MAPGSTKGRAGMPLGAVAAGDWGEVDLKAQL